MSRSEKYQKRVACPYCGAGVKILRKRAHVRRECPQAPPELKRASIAVSVKGKWRPRGD